MSVVVTGATGFIGRALVARLPHPIVLSRHLDRARRRLPGARILAWEPGRVLPPAAALEGARAVIHLAGEPIAQGRWSPAKKRRIRDSRIDRTRQLVAGLARLDHRPEVLVSASAIGYYGDRGEEELAEDAPAGSGFLAELCRDWESEARAAEAFGVRVVTLRIGIVLAPGGGALARMLPIFRWGLGGRMGTGRQWMSWIHREDLVEILLAAIGDPTLHGAVNAVSPHPVTHAEFTAVLARVLRRPAILPIPGRVLRWMLGELGDALLASQRVRPAELESRGFSFAHPRLEDALRAILHPGSPAPSDSTGRTD